MNLSFCLAILGNSYIMVFNSKQKPVISIIDIQVLYNFFIVEESLTFSYLNTSMHKISGTNITR